MCNHSIDELCPLNEWDNDPKAEGWICINCGEIIKDEPAEFHAARDQWYIDIHEDAHNWREYQ